jgi:hypothetical protein
MGRRFNGGRGNGGGRFRGGLVATVVVEEAFKIVLTTTTIGWSNLMIDNVGRHKIITIITMDLKEEAVGIPVAALMDRVLHIKIMIAITTKEIGDNEKILKTKWWIWKISLALSTMCTSHLTKTKWKKA